MFLLGPRAIKFWMCCNLENIFWSFKPSIEGFEYCLLVLSIDGTHLYGKYKDTLMIAMRCDENNQLFPLAFAITKGNNFDR